MRKLAATLILTIITLLTIGYSYACKSGGVKIKPERFDIAFISVETSDNEAEIDVAVTLAEITQGGNTIEICVSNAYPGYEAQVIYIIKNEGEAPAYFNSLTIINPSPEALEITTTDHVGIWLQPDQTIKGTTIIQILKGAEENQQYQIRIIIGISFQEERPRSLGFWKKQFDANLEKKGRPQIDAETLEEYLDQITGQSRIFEFAGNQRQNLQQALSILEMPRRPTMEDNLKAQLLTLWLNEAAEWTNGYAVEGMSAEQIIEGSEEALLNDLTDKEQYEYWKNLCEEFNNIGDSG